MKKIKKMDDINKKSKAIWEEFIKVQPETNLLFPDEILIRIFSKRYVQVPNPPSKLLDHGFGSGNNLVFFVMKGYECYGCEISNELIDVTKNKFEKLKLPIDLRVIEGDYLNYDNEFFDIVVSWNVIHYLGTREKIMNIIKEFHRILKPHGLLLVSTLHPDNSLLDRSVELGNGSYEIVKESRFDNRKGIILFSTKTKEELIELFSNFSEVKYGYYNFDLFLPEYRQAARLIYAIK